MNNNELKMNQKKTTTTECMLSQKKGRTPGPPPKLLVKISPTENKEILDTGSSRILGATIQANMSWSQHLVKGKDSLLPSVRRQLGALKHQGRNIPIRCRKLIATGLIMSRLAYIMPLWGSTTNNHIRKVQTLWNNISRWTTGLHRKTRTRDLMTANGWMSIKDMISYHSLIMVWKILYLKKPKHIYNTITTEDDNLILLTKPRLQFTSRGFKHRASLEWNQLPTTLRNEDSISIFKKTLKKWISEGRQQAPD